MYIKRHLEESILKSSAEYPALMLCGQRQVGKSTMLYHIKEATRTYVSLDDINARRLAESDPGLFFETYTPPVLIDEFQRVPSILLEIKKIGRLKIEVLHEKLNSTCTTNFYFKGLQGLQMAV